MCKSAFQWTLSLFAGIAWPLLSSGAPRATINVIENTSSRITHVRVVTPLGAYSLSLPRIHTTTIKKATRLRATVRGRGTQGNTFAAVLMNSSNVTVYLRDRHLGRVMRVSSPDVSGSRPAVATFEIANGIIGKTSVLRARPESKVYPKALPFRELSPLREFRIAIDTDSEFYDFYGAATEQRVKEIIFATSVLYAKQLGIELTVLFIGKPQGGSSNYALSNEAPELLNQFRDFTLFNKHLGLADAYLLMTGKKLNNGYIGISFQDSACFESGMYAFGLTQKVRPVLQPALVAHELAHILGARHDESSKTSIMNAYVNVEDNRFTSTSVNQIISYVEGEGSCLPISSKPGVGLAGSIVGTTLNLTTTLRNVIPSSCSLKISAAKSEARLDGVKAKTTAVPVLFSTATQVLTSEFPIDISVVNTPGLATPQKVFLRASAECGGIELQSFAIPLRVPVEADTTKRRTAPSNAAQWLNRLVSPN